MSPTRAVIPVISERTGLPHKVPALTSEAGKARTTDRHMRSRSMCCPSRGIGRELP